MAPTEPLQLVLDLPHRTASGAEDFLVSASNAAAVRLIDCWPDWPGSLLVLVGPEGCGKSHLANVWLTRSGGHSLEPRDLGDALSESDALLVEDADRRDYEETTLFHAVNAVRERGGTMLLTARAPQSAWRYELPDLVSRLSAAPAVAIDPPDEELMAALLVKHFADRQIEVDPSVLLYIVRRAGRSPSAVSALVAAMDRMALGSGRKVTRALAAEALSMHRGATD